MEYEKTKPNPNPWTRANFLSRLFYWWLIPLLRKGAKGGLKLTDIYDCPHVESSEKNVETMKKEWNKELQKLKLGKQPSLLKATIRAYGFRFCVYALLVVVQECVIVTLQPILLAHLVDHFTRINVLTNIDLCLYATGLCFLSFAFVFTSHPYFFLGMRTGMRLRIAYCSLMYRKVLKLSQAALSTTTTVGQIVNLLSNDVRKFDETLMFIPYLIIGPMQTAIILSILWMYIGYAGVAGISLLLLYIPLQGMVGKFFTKFRMKTALLSDERISLMNEIVHGIRVIKMYGWEIPYANLVDLCRRKEMKKIYRMMTLYSVNFALYQMFNKFILLVSFVVLVLGAHEDLTPEKLFVCMTLFNTLRLTMTLFFAKAVTTGAESITSIKRIQKFLLLEEREKTKGLNVSDFRPKIDECGIWVNNITASWNSNNDRTLQNVSLKGEPGKLLVVVGPVGCGKSSLFMSILGELPIAAGDIKIQGKLAYASQDPWVFDGSIRQNVVYGSGFDEAKYRKVLSACALDKDIQRFPYADRTLVGERGIRLSGGQKARINLARAMYIDADIYLLDDPLSAVDSSVSKHLFYKCINGYLKDKIRILATHQIQFLRKASEIMVLKQGGCLASGTYEQLMDDGVDLGFLKKDDEKDYVHGPASMTIINNSSVLDETENKTTSEFILKSTLSENIPMDVQYADIESKYLPYEKSPQRIAEHKSSGAINIKIYKEYIKSGAGFLLRFTVILSCIATQILLFGSDFWLAAWAGLEQRKYNIKDCWAGANKTFLNESGFYNNTHSVLPPDFIRQAIGNVSSDCIYLTQNYTEDINDANQNAKTNFHLSVYVGMIFIASLLCILRNITWFKTCIGASVTLHNKMFKSLLRSEIAFFDNNPVGRILNRFSKDTGIIDEAIPIKSMEVIMLLFGFLGCAFSVTAIEPFLLLPPVALVTAALLLRRFYLPTTRDVKRYEGITRSPVVSHLSVSLHGLTTIRAFNAQRQFEITFDQYQDQHTATWFTFLSVTRSFAMTLDLLSVIYVICVTTTMVILAKEPSFASKAGLAIVLTIQVVSNFQYGVTQASEIENQMTSVERVLEYSSLKSEDNLESEESKKPPNTWPSAGHIVYQNVSLKYSPNHPTVLNNITFEIFPEEKIGIVGRTGAGKSSIIATLFRMVKPEGIVKIDGMCTTDIGLHDLRKKISIIPQDPVLFTGPVRRNMDPFREHTDNELWEALEEAHLKETIKNLPGGLDYEISEGGANFSVGQRQLICLARAILRRNRILVLDEATANVDPKTDNLIQQTIRDRFTHCTVITIAHRLNTIMDSDRVMVLDEGEVKEFDEPYILLQNQNSLFLNMVQMTEPEMAKQLTDIARMTHLKRNRDEKENTLQRFNSS